MPFAGCGLPWAPAAIAARSTCSAFRPACSATNWPGARAAPLHPRRDGASALLAGLAGFAGPLAWWLALALVALHFVAVMADSAALTAGLVAATPPAKRGATLAVYSFFGFGAGFLGPLAFGLVFDLAGGEGGGWPGDWPSPASASPAPAGPLAIWLTQRKEKT
jgi:MFS family permease